MSGPGSLGPSVWAVSDGRAGNAAQVRAIVQALGETRRWMKIGHVPGEAHRAEPWEGEAKAMGSAFLRVGIVLGATWLALPELRKVPKWMFVSLLIAVVIVAWRPPTVVIVAPALMLLWALRGIAKTVE